MTIFQVISLVVLATAIVLVIVRATTRPNRLGAWLLWLLVFCGAFIAILRPQMIAGIAKAVGVGRGADLVLYLFAMVSLLGFFIFYGKIKRTDREITKLVRYIALQHPISNTPSLNEPPTGTPASDSRD